MTRAEAKLIAAVCAVTDALTPEEALTILISCVVHRCVVEGRTRQATAGWLEVADTALVCGGAQALKGMA